MSNNHNRNDEVMPPDQGPAGSSSHHQSPFDYDPDWDPNYEDDGAQNSGGDAQKSRGDPGASDAGRDDTETDDPHDHGKRGPSGKELESPDVYSDENDDLLVDDLEELKKSERAGEDDLLIDDLEEELQNREGGEGPEAEEDEGAESAEEEGAEGVQEDEEDGEDGEEKLPDRTVESLEELYPYRRR